MFGLALFTYGLSRFNRRFIPLVVGGLITFMVRPHILFTAILSVMLGVVLTSSGIKPFLRWFIFLLAAVVFIYISEDVLKFTETESLDITSSSTLSHRAAELKQGYNRCEYPGLRFVHAHVHILVPPLVLRRFGHIGDHGFI